MIINKKFDRLRQWTDERMGQKSKTEASDEFKSLEVEMGLRYEGMKENNRAMNGFVKNMGQRQEGEDKEKMTPVALMGSTMANHGDDFANDSNFGQCLTMYGRSNERIARAQETFVAKATGTWLESTERSLAQMKEYQAARKKLESRRLAYDTAQTKMDKSKKDDFRVEEEVRVQKAKYEESSEDVHRRMLDIREQEAESVQDLGDFLDAQLAYHDQCREILLQLRQEWPAPVGSSTTSTRSPVDDRPRPRVVSNSTPVSRGESRDRDFERPAYHRSTTFEGPRQLRREAAPAPPVPDSGALQPLQRIQSTPAAVQQPKAPVRSVANATDYDSGYDTSSPASSLASVTTASLRQVSGERRKAPPPPPPSRFKKPPPPPPPMRRGITAGAIE